MPNGKRSAPLSPLKNNKKRKYASKYKEAWKVKYPWVKHSADGSNFAYCTLCNANLNISSGGMNDLFRHGESQGHKTAALARSSSRKVGDFLIVKDSAGEKAVTKAECMFSNFVAKHNLSFAVADHFTKLVPKMFPDSEIAKKFHCGPTKTTQIVKGELNIFRIQVLS